MTDAFNSSPPSHERVCAIVVAFNRCAMLHSCLQHLNAQTRPLDHILVVNNASTDDTAEMVRREFPGATLLDLPDNGGGAGGFHAGMKHAFEGGFEWLWLMDDDVFASPNALETMLSQSASADVLVPAQQDALGRLYGAAKWSGRGVEVTEDVIEKRRPAVGKYVFTFAGPLLSRRVVEAVGLPLKEFFIWFDDAEYSLRVHQTALSIRVVPEAVLFHDVGGKPQTRQLLGRTLIRILPPPWKLYYGARNTLYVILRQTVSKRKKQRMLIGYSLSHCYQALQDILFEADRVQRLRMRLRGIKDGVTGNLGKKELS